MGKESIQSVAPLKEQVAADHARDATQLKAEHGKEMAALKAEEAQLLAAQKAEHSKTPGKTGLLAKLTGKEDPVKKAEKQELKAEIARAEELTKAEHDAENAQLKAHRTTDMSAIKAAHGSHASHALPAAGAAVAPAGTALEGVPDKKIYNHATGQHGQAALLANNAKHDHGIAAFADNGLGDRGHHSHHHSHRDGEYNGGINHNLSSRQDGLAPVDQGHGLNQGFNQGQAFQGQAFNQSAMPLATGAIPVQPVGLSSAPLATHSVPLSGASNVAVIAPSHNNHGGNRL